MKKVVITAISMRKRLELAQYHKEADGEFLSEPMHFPVIALMEWNILPGEEVEVITVRREIDESTQRNYATFKAELKEMEQRTGLSCPIVKEITVPHEETKEKQVALFKELCSVYPEGADVYIDLSFGTKMTTVCLFTSLTYAEKVKRCNIRHITYGLYDYNAPRKEPRISGIYNVRCLYDMASLIHTAEFLNAENIDTLIEGLWG